MHDNISIGILAEYNALRKERSNAITAMKEETQKISVVQFRCTLLLHTVSGFFRQTYEGDVAT